MNYIGSRTCGAWTVVNFETDRLTDAIALHAVERELFRLLADEPNGAQVVICLEGLEYVSSQVAGILLGAKKIIASRRGRLALCRVGEHLSDMLRMTRLDSQFEIKPRLRDVLGKDAPRPSVRRRELVGAGAPAASRGTSFQAEPEWID